MPDLFSILAPVIASGLETRKIDLKREIDLSDKPRAAKFAKIVSALANTPGGTAYIVMGVRDRKDRVSADPHDYVVGFDPDRADDFQRQMQQALYNNLEPVPIAELRPVEHPSAGKTLGVIQIARSFHRPHRVKKASGEIEQGVYLKRGAELSQANPDEIEAMQAASQDSRLILNFARPLTHAQLLQLQGLLGALPEVVDLPGIPVQFGDDTSLAGQVVDVLDNAGVTLEEWAALHFIINPPGLAPAASAVLAEIHGRSGHFPHVIRMAPTPEDRNVYKVVEIVKLQNIRDAARLRATRP
jgi:hypothetical protein